MVAQVRAWPDHLYPALGGEGDMGEECEQMFQTSCRSEWQYSQGTSLQGHEGRGVSLEVTEGEALTDLMFQSDAQSLNHTALSWL